MKIKTETTHSIFTENAELSQEQIVANIVAQYQDNNILARSILTGDNLAESNKFEEDIWFDLDQTRRQAKLDGKPYRDPSSYLELLKPLRMALANIAFFSFLQNLEDSCKSGEMRKEILIKHGITQELYAHTVKQITTIKHQGKEKKINLANKEDAEKTIKEYIAYRVAKNSLHSALKNLFPQHFRKQSVDFKPIETDYMYYTGYQPTFEADSVVKIGFPSVPEDQNKFIPRNRVKNIQHKVIATPASWSYIFSDLPIDLFRGRKGKIAFALIGLEKNMMTMFQNHKDSSSTSLIKPFYLEREIASKELGKVELLQKKKNQRQKMLENPYSYGDDPWFDTKTKVSGHTESVIYGAPTEGGIIIQKGFEDIAWEARKRYAQYGFMPKNAPFFTYDPYQGLTQVNDEEVLKQAKACHVITKNRLTYNPTSCEVKPNSSSKQEKMQVEEQKNTIPIKSTEIIKRSRLPKASQPVAASQSSDYPVKASSKTAPITNPAMLKAINVLQKHINELQFHGQNLMELSKNKHGGYNIGNKEYIKGNKIDKLVQKLNTKLEAFKESTRTKTSFETLSTNCIDALDANMDTLDTHREEWVPYAVITGNILFALTGIGAVVLAVNAIYVATATREGLTLHSGFFGMRTTAEKQALEIESDLKELGCKMYGTMSLPSG